MRCSLAQPRWQLDTGKRPYRLQLPWWSAGGVRSAWPGCAGCRRATYANRCETRRASGSELRVRHSRESETGPRRRLASGLCSSCQLWPELNNEPVVKRRGWSHAKNFISPNKWISCLEITCFPVFLQFQKRKIPVQVTKPLLLRLTTMPPTWKFYRVSSQHCWRTRDIDI